MHAALSALVLTGATEIANSVGVLGALDAFWFTTLNRLIEPKPLDAAAAGMPRLVLIDDVFYADYFGRVSPLDRNRLAALIDEVASRKPRVLAIDLDLAPDRAAFDDPGEAAGRLYDVLCRHARPDLFVAAPGDGSCLDRAARSASSTSMERCGTRIALIEPLVAHVPDIDARNRAWQGELAARLSPCLSFARSDIEIWTGRALDFDPASPTLGVVAHALSIGDVLAHPGGELHQESRHRRINRSLIDAAVVEKRFASFAPTPLTATLRIAEDGLRPVLDLVSSLSGQTVFLGGTWGDDDKHGTAAKDRIDGVIIHAAVYRSLDDPITERPHWAALIDLGLGTVTGLGLQFFWARANTARRRYRALMDKQESAFSGRFLLPDDAAVAYARLFGFALGAWLVFLTAAGAVILGSRFVLAGGWWLNPAPMLIGLQVHMRLASSEEGERHRRAVASENQPALLLLGRSLYLVKYAVGGLVVLGGLAALWSH